MIRLAWVCIVLALCTACQQQRSHFTVPYGQSAKQKIDIYLPVNYNDSTPMLILFHGGGWSSGDRTDHAHIAERLQALGIASASVGYRLANSKDQIAAPEISNDVRSGVAKVLALRSQWGIRRGKLGLFGISAGAHLSLLYAYAYDSLHQINQVIAYAGPSDLNSPQLLARPIMTTMVNNYLARRPGGDSLDAKAWSPVNFIDSLDPKTLLIHGDLDTVVHPLQSQVLDSILRAHHVKSELIRIPTSGHSISKVTMDHIIQWIYRAML